MPAPPRRWIAPTLFGLLGVLVLAIAVSGAFLVGRDTRLSDQQVDAKLAAQATRAKGDQELAVKAAKRIQKKTDRKIWTKRLNKAVENARETGYSSGTAVGFSSGHATGVEEGVEEGLVKASDELTCSDDFDVPLPPC